MDIREGLAARVDAGAAWRDSGDQTAAQGGNRRSADALRELSEHVMGLPQTDGRLQAIAELGVPDGAFPDADHAVDRMIAAYGSNRQAQSHPDTFLRNLVAVADKVAKDRRLSRRGTDG
jgi:hypothetical protein